MYKVCYVCHRESGGLTPRGGACIGSGENYMSGGRNIGYVMELAEHRGAPSHCTLKRTTPLECTHYLHLQERERTITHTYTSERQSKDRARGEIQEENIFVVTLYQVKIVRAYKMVTALSHLDIHY